MVCRIMTVNGTEEQTCLVQDPVPTQAMLVTMNTSIFYQKWSHVLDHVSTSHTTLSQVKYSARYKLQ